MARQGEFSGGSQPYGTPISVVKAPDNKPGSPYAPELSDATLKLTEEQKREIQRRIDELTAVIEGERDWYG